MMMLMSGRSVSALPVPGVKAAPLGARPVVPTAQFKAALLTQTRTVPRRSGQVRRLQTRASSSSAEATTAGSGVAEASPYVPLVAAAGFLAAWIQKYTVQREHVLVALAAVALANSALSVFRTGIHADWVSHVAAPAVLAWHALNLKYHYFEVAIAVFGWYLCKNLEGPAVAWAVTLGVALYSRVGAEWYAAAYAVVAAWKLFRGYQKDSKLTLQLAPPVIASIWALYKKCPVTWTVILMLSQIAGSAFGMVRSVSSELSN